MTKTRRLLALVCALLSALAFGTAASAADGDGAALLRCEQNEALGLAITGLQASVDPVTVEAFVPMAVPVTAEGVQVATAEGETCEATAPVGTGMNAIWTVDGEEQAAVIVVTADCTGSGVMGLTQLARLADAYTGADPLEGPYLVAVDFTEDGQIGLTDLTREAALYRDAQDGQISGIEEQEIIAAAVALQTSGGTYQADAFHVVRLAAGQTIYGMLPGQSAFYTDLATVEECGGSYVKMYEKLQMLPHPEYGYREQLGVYQVKEDMWVATGQCLANSVIDGQEAGEGGGTQYVIPDYEEDVELLDTVDLHE